MSGRLILLAMVALLPGRLKIAFYRGVLRYRVGKRVQVGLSIIDARDCVIEDDVVIGHFNALVGIHRLHLGDHVRIGHLNVIRGGANVLFGRYAELLRLNEINSISRPDSDVAPDPTFELGPGSVVTTGHKIDFTNRVRIGRRSVVAGRNSTIWTHTRQTTAPVEIGDFVYVGSESRISGGVSIPARTVVGMGSVLIKPIENGGQLVAGVPARPRRALTAEDQTLLENKTRRDLPDDF